MEIQAMDIENDVGEASESDTPVAKNRTRIQNGPSYAAIKGEKGAGDSDKKSQALQPTTKRKHPDHTSKAGDSSGKARAARVTRSMSRDLDEEEDSYPVKVSDVYWL